MDVMGMKEKVEEESLKHLDREVSNLAWQGKLWGRKGAIAQSRLRFEYQKRYGRELHGLSALSSTYYTAWGNALARAKLNWPLAIFWLVVSFYCLWQAVVLSDELDRRVGIKNMTVGELDVRVSIMAAAFFRRGHRWEAWKCIDEALSRKVLSHDDRALLLRKKGEIFDRVGSASSRDVAKTVFRNALSIAHVTVATKARVLLSFARHELKCRHKENAKKQLAEALTLAKKYNLGDQILKIRALMKKVK